MRRLAGVRIGMRRGTEGCRAAPSDIRTSDFRNELPATSNESALVSETTRELRRDPSESECHVGERKGVLRNKVPRLF